MALLRGAHFARELAEIFPENRRHFLRNGDAPILDCSGAQARVNAALTSFGAARP